MGHSEKQTQSLRSCRTQRLLQNKPNLPHLGDLGYISAHPAAEKTNPIPGCRRRSPPAPQVKHERVTGAVPARSLIITAQVHDPGGVKWVRLCYRSVTQFQDYKTLKMTETDKTGEYKAIVPGQDIEAKWDFMYLIKVMDNNGNGTIYPDIEEEAPYIVVRLDR
jgi:hypothetical protein